MRVASSNLQHGVPDPLGRPDLGRAVAPLRTIAADVHAFQELDHRRWRTRFEHQGAVMADALAGELAWARAKQWLWAGQANALVVRGRVGRREVHTLPGPGERRIALLAEVELHGERWSVATTHLALDPFVAALQLATVLVALSACPAPQVLVGDLNLCPADVAPVAAFHGYDLLEGPNTINARTGLNRRLDHVLTRGCTVIDSGTTKLPVSDHLTVWAEVSQRRP
ncbi:MAG: endonuclease/exonuclease/phosphatase family protein [Acidimicrobiales bacterium]